MVETGVSEPAVFCFYSNEESSNLGTEIYRDTQVCT